MSGIHFMIFILSLFLLYLELYAAFPDIENQSTETRINCRLDGITSAMHRIGAGIENLVDRVGGNGIPWTSGGPSTCCHLFPKYKEELKKIKNHLEKLEEKIIRKYPASCAEVQKKGHRKTGVYWIRPRSPEIHKPVAAYCDLTTVGGGWTVFQKRDNNGNPNDYFLRKWKDYKEGFGNPEKDYWLGNDILYALTNQEKVELRFDLWDWKGNHRYASTKYFQITEPKTYKITWTGYSGNAGNNLPASGLPFSTIDQDHDTWRHNCAKRYKGAWWYSSCHSSNLNGFYNSTTYAQGLTWATWKGYYYSLKKTEIKLRPKNFKRH